jgi:hypothetical protein
MEKVKKAVVKNKVIPKPVAAPVAPVVPIDAPEAAPVA